MGKIIFICALFIFTGCADNYVARVGSKKITAGSFKNRMLDVPTYYRGFLETEGGRRQYIDGIVNESVLVELAKDRGIHRRPEVKERIEVMSDQILLEYIVEEMKKSQLKVTDKEITDYYETHRDFYLHSPRARVSHILVSSKEEAQRIYSQIKNGASFAALAQNNSIDRDTALNGGDLGYFERGDMVPAFEEAAFELNEPGDISPVVKTPFGWHIIKLTGKSVAASKTKDDAKDEITELLRKEKLDSILEFYKKKFNVKVKYEKLAGIQPPWHIPARTEEGK